MMFSGLLIVFFLSGATALIYQVAWQRLLTVYYGVGAVSITLIVSVYMAGLGFGALWGGRLAEKVERRVLFYFVIELCIGLFGGMSPFLLDFIGRRTAGSPYLWAAFYMVGFLLIPTLLMGMTLPLLTKTFSRLTQNYVYSISLLYFFNTLGAAAGAIVSSYGLITFGGLDIAVYTAAATNLVLAAAVFFISRFPAPKISSSPKSAATNLGPAWGQLAYLAVFATGFLAIGYEMIWFRLTSFFAKNSPYSFSSALAVYLFGIALGSLGMNKILSRHPSINGTRMFLLLQFFIGFYVLASFVFLYYAIERTHFVHWPYLSFHITLHPTPINMHALGSIPRKEWLDALFLVSDVFFWPIFFVLLPTMAMGASFPLIAGLALTDRTKEGWTTGKIYFMNIMGNVLGGALTGFLFFPLLGTERAALIFSVLGVVFGLLALLREKSFIARTMWALCLAIAVFLCVIFPQQGKLYAAIHFPQEPKANFYFEEGVEGVVATYQKGDWVENYIHGCSHGGRPGDWFYYPILMAMLRAPQVADVLVIGYGTGSTVEALLKSDEVNRLTLVEINQTLIRNLRKMPLFDEMLSDPRVRLVLDDGRRFLLRTNEKYDLIAMDPLQTTSAYSNNIYSADFLKLIKSHLKKEGVLEMWSDEYIISMGTVLSVFPRVRIYGTFYVAFNGPNYEANTLRVIKAWESFSPPITSEKMESLSQLPFFKYIGMSTREMSDFRFVNRDWRPYMEYYLGLPKRYKALKGVAPFQGKGEELKLKLTSSVN